MKQILDHTSGFYPFCVPVQKKSQTEVFPEPPQIKVFSLHAGGMLSLLAPVWSAAVWGVLCQCHGGEHARGTSREGIQRHRLKGSALTLMQFSSATVAKTTLTTQRTAILTTLTTFLFLQSGQAHRVSQFQVFSWNPNGTTTNPRAIIGAITSSILLQKRNNSGPIVAHCRYIIKNSCYTQY